jgi:pectin methylesterase-like acyl-CoA thioesterase
MATWLTPIGGSQAEALRTNSQRCSVRDVDFSSYQDTLFLNGRVYFTNCYIEGDVDFIWGGGAAFFNRCEIRALRRQLEEVKQERDFLKKAAAYFAKGSR